MGLCLQKVKTFPSGRFIGKNGLMRAQGLYNFEKHEWEKKTSSLVCNSINQVRFVLEKCEFQGLYIGVWVIYKCFGSDLEKKIFVRFRNKVVM